MCAHVCTCVYVRMYVGERWVVHVHVCVCACACVCVCMCVGVCVGERLGRKDVHKGDWLRGQVFQVAAHLNELANLLFLQLLLNCLGTGTRENNMESQE